ncbi:MAG: hypothetical protein OES12_11045 [Anaerolineae bacterium]|nr:hypothetical protein [Anaerolineae bacterium]
MLRKTLSYDLCSLHWLDEKVGVVRLSGNTTTGQSRGVPAGETIPPGHDIAGQVALVGQGQIADRYLNNVG